LISITTIIITTRLRIPDTTTLCRTAFQFLLRLFPTRTLAGIEVNQTNTLPLLRAPQVQTQLSLQEVAESDLVTQEPKVEVTAADKLKKL
jgi:hypothetical protein